MHVQSLPNDDVIILVADFDGPDGQNNRVTETILRQLRDATDDYDDVEVIALGQAVTEQAGSNQARRLAEKKKADIMIWGWYGQTSDTVPISANFELLEENEYIPDDLGDSASGAIQTFDIAELNSFSLQTRLSNEMSFLTLFTLGMADYANDNWADAIALFEDALRQTEEASERLELSIIHFYRGESYASNERPNDAIQAYNQALNIKPNDYITLNNKGNVLTNLGLLDDAIKNYDLALQIKHDYHVTLYNKGNALFELGLLDNAIKNYDLALQIKHDYSDALSNKGAALAQLGEFDNAITAFEQALKIQPDNYILLYNKGLALARLGEARAAVKAYNKALNIKPDDHAALNNKGLVLARLGDFDNAIASSHAKRSHLAARNQKKRQAQRDKHEETSKRKAIQKKHKSDCIYLYGAQLLQSLSYTSKYFLRHNAGNYDFPLKGAIAASGIDIALAHRSQ